MYADDVVVAVVVDSSVVVDVVSVGATGATVAVVVGVGAEVGVLAAAVAVWRKAPPGIEAEDFGAVLVVGAGAAASEELVAGAGAELDEPEDPDPPEPPEEKVSELVRLPMVPGRQELGPEDQPIRRLATSEA
jgi:hypothetical protein